jgi:hypothetical protein
MRYLAVLLMLVVATPGAAQVQSRPTDAPLVTADNESWYQLRDPVQFAGDLYYPAGPTVFFNGNTMVRAGHYNGVPLYADTTIEPYSIIYVPIRRGLMQPYERLRRGDLAGTTGSRTPTFPVALQPQAGRALIAAAVSPTAAPQTIGAVSVFTPAVAAVQPSTRPFVPAAGSTPEPPIVARPPDRLHVTLLRPESNDGVWIQYMGGKWLHAGAAVPLTDGDFQRAGDYEGFPVYARHGVREDVIYVPTRAGLVVPYRLKRQ